MDSTSRRLAPLRALSLSLALVLAPAAARAATLPTGFQESIVFANLTQPTAVQFAADGRVFVSEKSGLIKVFASLTATTPTIFADLRVNVHNYWDRGLLGLALHPNFPTTPYVYVLYTLNAAPGAAPPRWPTIDGTNDDCPDPPGATTNGCVVGGRLSRLTASGNVMTGSEQVLIENWCQQFPSHSIGSLAFGADGALYATGGDGASFNYVDYGQTGNPCADPGGSTPTPPTAEGGSLRSQDIRTSGDPTSLDGALIRIDPITGGALSDNPLYGGAVADDDRIVAHGFRNPFRMTMRPGTNEAWVGDVGWNTWEEIDRVVNPLSLAISNMGWPCYEGSPRQSGYDSANVNICENLYTAGTSAVVAPVFAYRHADKIVTGETCSTGSSSISGLAFYNGGTYPTAYAGALFFADYSRNCIWTMFAGTNGIPNPATRANFVTAASKPVDLKIGPGGDLFYVDLGGTVRRVRYFSANQPPNAVVQADVTSGTAPLTVHFDASASTDPNPGDVLSYAWDLDGNGQYNDSTAIAPVFTYALPGTYAVGLRVTDSQNASSFASLTIVAGNSPPTATITAPTAGLTWNVGDVVAFSATATDPQEGTLPASRFTWSLIMHHCPSDCHEHVVQEFVGVVGGFFFAPDHEYPSFLELRLTVTDSSGLTDVKSRVLDPNTVTLNFASVPSGLALSVGPEVDTTPFSRTVIVGSANSVIAPAPQSLGAVSYEFSSWSDGGAQSHILTAPTAPLNVTASFVAGCVVGTVSCNDGNPCTTDTCDPLLGCQHASSTAACSDGNACTTGDVCQAGACVGAALNCDDGNPCTTDGCNPATGCTHTNTTAACNDGNACTTGDTCQAGTCTGAALGCDDGNPCTADTCDPATGCVHTNTAAACDDGNACTTGDTCSDGVCTSGAALDCDDANPCTTDTCNPASGCLHTNNTAPCDDGNACTTGDVCSGGVCTGGPALDCDDGNPCTDQLCDQARGCLYAPNSASCSDGNACTTGDVCAAGVCVGGNPAAGCTACAAAATIPAQGGTFVGQTSGTSSLAGSCANTGAAPERVFRWTPAVSGTASIGTCGAGTTFDSVVYLKSADCAAGTELTCNDDTPGCGVADGTANAGQHGSRITPTVTAGQTYFIVVDGWSTAAGTFALTVDPPHVCGNGVREAPEACDGADAALCPSGLCAAGCQCAPPAGGLADLTPAISDLTLERGTTVASADVAEGCAEATSGVDLLRFTVRTSNVGTADFVLGDPGCPSPCSAYPLQVCANPSFVCSAAAGHNHAHYTNFARYELLDAANQAVIVGHKQGYCVRDTTCAAPRYTCTDQGNTAGCSDEYTYTLGCQYQDVTGVPAGTYTLRVTVDPFGLIGELSEGNNVATVPVVIPPPALPTTTSTTATSTTSTTSTTLAGGACGAPTVVPPTGGVFAGTTSGASTLAGTCATSGNSPERVFQWTPSVSGTASIFTCSPNTRFDTVMYLRAGACGGAEAGCNDDTPGCATGDGTANAGFHGSRLTPTVTAGQTYFVVVDGYNGAGGQFELSIVPPVAATTTTTLVGATTTTSTSLTTTTSTSLTTTTSTTATSTTSTSSTTLAGGACAAPTVVQPAGGLFTGSTSGASSLAGSCSTSGNSPEHVYRWTPDVSGIATIETCGAPTTFDTVLYLAQGTCGGPEAGCNDDTVGCPTSDGTANASRHGSRLTPTVTAGQTYFIVVDGYNGLAGTYQLNIVPPGVVTTTTTSTSSTTSTTIGQCAAPTVIQPGGDVVTGTTSGGSTLAGTCATSGNSPEKVFQWTPSRSGVATIETCSATETAYDTVLYLRQGTCVGGAEVGCNDDTVGCGTADGSANASRHGSRLTPTVTAGQTYFIVVDGYNGLGGNFRLSVISPP